MKSGRRSSSARAGGVLAGNLMLTPVVMALRTPLLMAEAGRPDTLPAETSRAIAEKMLAATQGAMAAQLSLAHSAASFWPEFLSGKTPSLVSGEAFERAMHAALKPAGQQVKKNYRRLKKGS